MKKKYILTLIATISVGLFIITLSPLHLEGNIFTREKDTTKQQNLSIENNTEVDSVIGKFVKGKGDGYYTLRVGDTVQSTNGVYITINYLDKDLMGFSLHDSEGKLMRFYNQWTWNDPWSSGDEKFYSDFGIKMSFRDYFSKPSTKTRDELEITIKLESGLMEKVVFGQPMYEKCLEYIKKFNELNEQDKLNSCRLYYSTNIPVDDEVSFENDTFIVILPKELSENGLGILSNSSNCLNLLLEKSNLQKLDYKIPIRYLYDNAAFSSAYASNLGIQFRVKTNSDLKYPVSKGCSDSILLHELLHMMIMPIGIYDIYNEGLATYFQNITYPNISALKPIEKNLLINNTNKKWSDGVNTYSYALSEESNTKLVLSYDSNGKYDNSMSVENGFASPIYTNSDNSQPKYIIEMLESNDDFAKINIYEGKTEGFLLSCEEDGYIHKMGWYSEIGKFIPLAPTNYFDGGFFDYMDLDEYLSPKFPYWEFNKHFYRSSACFWQKVEDRKPGAVNEFLKSLKQFGKSGVNGNMGNLLSNIIGPDYLNQLVEKFQIDDIHVTIAAQSKLLVAGDHSKIFPLSFK